VNLCAFYFYKLIGKLTAFLQLQEFNFRNPTRGKERGKENIYIEVKRIYIDGCRYNERLNSETGGSRTPHIIVHWVVRSNIQQP
jgi:hypothetical protein